MDLKKRISIFSLSMGSGGAERVISNLLPRLVIDYDVTLFLVFNVFHYTLPENIKLFVVSKKSRLSHIDKILLIPKVFIHYLRFVKSNKIDISISFLTVPNFLNGLTSLFYKAPKFIISERNYPSHAYGAPYLKFALYKILIPLLYTRADCIFSNSEWINKDLKENFGVRAKMEVVYNPVILPQLTKDPQSFSQQQLKFTNVGRIFATKNQKMIINAFSDIGADEYLLSFYGEGNMKDELIELVYQKRKLCNIIFKGNVSDVNFHLLDHDCFILSSNSEGFPNALLEAMAIGLPVISTNCKSGPLELLNENESIFIPDGECYLAKYGILINVNDHIGLNKAVRFFLENKSMLKEYSKKSLERAADFELDVIYKKLKTIVLD